MRLSKLFLSVLVISACLMPLESNAQAKRRSSNMVAPTTRSTPAKKTSSSSAAVTAAKLKGNEYLFMMDSGGMEMSLCLGSVELTSASEFVFYNWNDDSETKGKWTLTGSKLALTIPSSGKTLFTGNVGADTKKFTGSADGNKVILYNITAPKTNPSVSEIKKSIVGGKYNAFLVLFPPGENMPVLVPATVKFTPTDSNSGTFKITGTSQIYTLAGVLKGEYRFEGEDIYMSAFGNEEDYDSLTENPNYIVVNLGDKKINQMGTFSLGVYLVK